MGDVAPFVNSPIFKNISIKDLTVLSNETAALGPNKNKLHIPRLHGSVTFDNVDAIGTEWDIDAISSGSNSALVSINDSYLGDISTPNVITKMNVNNSTIGNTTGDITIYQASAMLSPNGSSTSSERVKTQWLRVEYTSSTGEWQLVSFPDSFNAGAYSVQATPIMTTGVTVAVGSSTATGVYVSASAPTTIDVVAIGV